MKQYELTEDAEQDLRDVARYTLYKGLSGDVDTRISTVFKVLGQMGIQLRAVRSSESAA